MGAFLPDMDHAFINPRVLKWARERRSLSPTELAGLIGVSVSQVESWEKDAAPPFGRAEQLAQVLRIPFGFLYLSDPPDDKELAVPDLRTLGDARRYKISPNFIDLLHDVLRKQEWYREYSEINKLPKLPFVARFSLSDDVERVAAHLRNTLNINDDMRRGANTWAKYFSLITDAAERNGILVIRSGFVEGDTGRTLSAKEFQGFALSDPLAPVVFVNTRDFITARIFTLAHELAHIWIGASGISKPDANKLPKGSGSRIEIERFCNSVATEVLTPKTRFAESWDGDASASANVTRLATQFRVSEFVTIRRARDLELIGSNDVATLRKAAQERQRKTPVDIAGGGNPYLSIRQRNSPRFTDTVLTALRYSKLAYRDAARLLAVGHNTLEELAKRNY